jgi:hypothetical protein
MIHHFLISFFLTFQPPPSDLTRLKHNITHSNRRDTIMLQNMTVKQFKNRLSEIETGGYSDQYKVVNKYGYLGKYQISQAFLVKYGGGDREKYLRSAWIQERTMNKLCRHYLYEIDRIGLEKYVGKEINGITITLEGLMAGFHQHPVALVKWLKTNGKIDKTDGFDYPVSKFVETFSPTKTL